MLGASLLGQSVNGLAAGTNTSEAVTNAQSSEKPTSEPMMFTPNAIPALTPETLHAKDLREGNLDDFERTMINEFIKIPVADEYNPAKREFTMGFGELRMRAADAGASSEYSQHMAPLPETGYAASLGRMPTIGRWGILTKTAKMGPAPPGIGGNIQYMSSNFEQGSVGGDTLDMDIFEFNTLSRGSIQSVRSSTNYSIVAKNVTGHHYPGIMPIRYLYKSKNPNKPQLIAYADVDRVDKTTYGQMRMVLSAEGNVGRISGESTFQYLDSVPRYYAIGHGVHADLAGNHKDTKTRSLGDQKGAYMDIDGKSAGQITPDKMPYRLYYYTDGYDNQPDASIFTGDIENLPWYTVGAMFRYEPIVEQGLAIDPGEGKVYPSSHPAYGFWYNARQMNAGDTFETRLDMAVTTEIWKETRSVITRYLDDKGNPLEVETSKEYPKTGDYSTDSKKAFYAAQGWELDEANLPSNASGPVGQADTAIVVEYHFKDRRENNLTIKYQDEAGIEIAAQTVKPFKFGDTYSEKALDLSGKDQGGWTLMSPSDTVSGTMGASPITETFVYRKGKINIVTEYYKREAGGALSEMYATTTKDFGYHEAYETEDKKAEATADGYTLESSDTGSPITGTTGAVDGTLTVKYVYKLGQVTVQTKHVKDDGTGNLEELFGTTTPNASYGYNVAYDTDARKDEAIKLGYVLSKTTGDPIKGNTGTKDKTIEVTYVYVKGKLTLTAPDEIDFGTQGLIISGTKDRLPKENIKISILDELESKWDLKLQLSTNVTHTVDGSPIKGIFKFVRNDGTQVEIGANAETVHSKTAVGTTTPDVQLEWDTTTNKGLIFEQLPGNKKDNYSGQFTWTLEDAL